MKNIREIREEFEAAEVTMLPFFVEKYAQDPRNGVQALVERGRKTLAELEAERERIDQMRLYERKYSEFSHICGVDEAGRGPLAGPVVAAAVILPKDCEILYVDDSKKLSPRKREALYDEICEQALAVGVGCVDEKQIDAVNILQATYEAMRQAIQKLAVTPDIILIDAVRIPGVEIRQVPIVGGDGKSITIAAASIIAKVTRDRMMDEYDREYPQYGFGKHKGYGTAAHREAIREFGPLPIHRKTFLKNKENH